MKIYFDPREGSKDFVSIPPLDTCSELLDSSIMDHYGDFLVMGNGPDGSRHIAGEIKSLADFIQSLNSGRLCATQLPKMFPHCDQIYLLVYGQTRTRDGELQWSMDDGHSWSKAYGGKRTHESTLLSTCTEFEAAGIHFHLHPNRESLALRIHTIATWWSRQWSSHTLFQSFDRSTEPKRNNRAGLRPIFDNDAQHYIALIADRLPNIGKKNSLRS